MSRLATTQNPSAALKEFDQSQIREPNRLRGYAGAAPAEAAGERAKAREHYAKLVDLTRDADTSLPEIARAKRCLATQ